MDEEPVRVIILFAVKNTDANTMHIKLLQKVAMLLADEDFIRKYGQCSDQSGNDGIVIKGPNGRRLKEKWRIDDENC